MPSSSQYSIPDIKWRDQILKHIWKQVQLDSIESLKTAGE